MRNFKNFLTENVSGNVYIKFDKIVNGKIPGNYTGQIINGNFEIDSHPDMKSRLTTLEGCPEIVNGAFMVASSYITSLEFCPSIVKGKMSVRNSHALTSLKGNLKECKDFDCSYSPLTSLEGSPQDANEFLCVETQVKSFAGAPMKCNEFFASQNFRLITLEGIGRKYLKECSVLNIQNCVNIKSNILGILVIKKLRALNWVTSAVVKEPECSPAMNIIRRAFNEKIDLLETKEKLIEQGYKDYAKL